MILGNLLWFPLGNFCQQTEEVTMVTKTEIIENYYRKKNRKLDQRIAAIKKAYKEM